MPKPLQAYARMGKWSNIFFVAAPFSRKMALYTSNSISRILDAPPLTGSTRLAMSCYMYGLREIITCGQPIWPERN